MLNIFEIKTIKWFIFSVLFVFSILSTSAGATASSNRDLHLMIMGLKHEMNLLKKENVNLKKNIPS